MEDEEIEDVFETKISEAFGRHLISKKHYRFGDLIFIENPIMVSPFLGSIEKEQFICCGCNKRIQKQIALSCSDCHWYACNQNCLDEPWHVYFECELFRLRKIPPTFYALKYLYLVRSLITEHKDKEAWKAILKLSSHVAVEDHLESSREQEAELAWTFLNKRCLFPVEKDLVLQLLRIFFVNTFTMSPEDMEENRYQGEALYVTSCILAHSCSPNVDWVVMSTDEAEGIGRWKMYLYARKEIKPGEMLTIPYVHQMMSNGTMERRLSIVKTLSFECKCDRCSDPSEFNTNYSGIVCKKCSGVVLPLNPHDSLTDLKCGTCGDNTSKSKAEELEEKFLAAFNLIMQKASSDNKFDELDTLIKNCSTEYGLYENNSKVIKAKIYWSKYVNSDVLLEDSVLASQKYELIMTRAKNCQQISSTVGDLYSWINCEGIIAKTIFKYRFKSNDFTVFSCSNYTLSEWKSILEQIVEHAERAVQLIKPNHGNKDVRAYQIQMSSIVEVCKKKLIDVSHVHNETTSSATNNV